MLETSSKKVFVVAANIAAELHFAVKQAKELSLTAKNARAIAVRAGNKTAGFRAITDYIDMLSQTTVDQAQNINKLAIKISRLSVQLARVDGVISKYQWAQKRSIKAEYIQSLSQPFEKLLLNKQALQLSFDKCNYLLNEAIIEARKHMRSANVISTSSKVEACRADEFNDALMVIAENIETTSDNIKRHLDKAIQLKNTP